MKGEKANVQTPKAALSLVEDKENKNPNLYIPKKAVTKTTSSADQKQKLDGNALKPKLRSTFSARNLKAGKELLNQITGFCSEIKKLA